MFIGVYLVTIELRVEHDPEPIAVALSNPFGVFAFEPVLPCSAYTVTARHRFFTFGPPIQIDPKDFPADGSGVAVTVLTQAGGNY